MEKSGFIPVNGGGCSYEESGDGPALSCSTPAWRTCGSGIRTSPPSPSTTA